MLSVELKENKKQNILWLVLFALSLGLMIWKLPYGFGGDDEGFYLTIAHRLTLGDRLFTNEWHLSQLSSFFLYPFVCIYKAVTGGTDGILFASRCMYLVFHSFTSAAVYLRLRKLGTLSVLGSIFFMLFTPFDMMTCSYNTIALDMLALTAAFVSPMSGKLSLEPGGAFFACAVVCCPYLALGYALYILLCILYPLLYKKTGREFFAYELFTVKSLLAFTAGIAAVFVLFAVFLLSHTSVKEIIAALPGLFSDPEHPSYSVFYMLKHYVWCIFSSHRLAVIPLGLYALSLVLLIFDKSRKKHVIFHIALPAAAAAVYLVLMLPEAADRYFNGIMLPLSFVSLNAYILLEKKPRALFAAGFALPFIYTLCVCSTSNMGFDILTTGFSVMNIAGLIFIGNLIREQSGRTKKSLVLCCLIPVVLLGILIVTVKQNHCFWDASPGELTAKLDRGPAKGIVTNEYFSSSYNSICNDMQCYKGESGNILIYSQQAWEYLIPDMPYGTFSAWLSGLDEAADERLKLYCEMNPDKIPDFVYIPKTSAFGELNIPAETIYAEAEKYGYDIEENRISYKLKK